MTDTNQDGLTQDQQNAAKEVDSASKKTEDNKRFTQEDVNSIVTGRLAKEKEKYHDYDAIKNELSELREVKNKYTELEKSSKIHLDTLNDVYSGLTSELDDDKKNLIPDGLSLTDKIRYINKNRKTFEIRQVIQTPPREDISKGEAGLYGGKYKTLQEWATQDPQGYMKWRREPK